MIACWQVLEKDGEGREVVRRYVLDPKDKDLMTCRRCRRVTSALSGGTFVVMILQARHGEERDGGDWCAVLQPVPTLPCAKEAGAVE